MALDAAEAGGQHALFIKLSNNMGAVLRKQELHQEVRLRLPWQRLRFAGCWRFCWQIFLS